MEIFGDVKMSQKKYFRMVGDVGMLKITHWNSLVMFGDLWRSLEMCIKRWLEIFGDGWRSLEMRGDLWRCVEIFGDVWRSLER